MINLKVKTLDSENHDFAVDDKITVRQFKEQIAEKISVSVELQRLIYCGRVLADDKPLKDYDLNGKVVHLVQRAPPSARGTSLSGGSGAESSGRGGDEASRASRRSRSSDNASRNIFRGLDDLNTMYFGSMTSIPLNVSAANATQIPSVSSSSTLCNNRITVARHMLECADSILSYLENPARGLNYSSMDYLSQQTLESTVFEVGISTVGDVDIPHNQVQSFVNAFQGAVSAAFRQNGMSNVTVQQPDGFNGSVQVFGTVPDFAVHTPPNTSATATPAHEGSGTSSTSSSSSSNASSSSSSGGGASSSSSSASSSTSESSAESRRQARPEPTHSQTTSTQTLGDVVQHMRNVQRRMEPFLHQYLSILQDDPAFDPSDTVGPECAQRVFDRVSEAMHYIAHAQHAISDLMLDLQMATPRHLYCRPILVEQNAYVSSGMASVPNNINLTSLLRNNMNNNNNNNNNPEVGNNNINAPFINLGIAAQPAFFTGLGGGGSGGSSATTMRPPASTTATGPGTAAAGGTATSRRGAPTTTQGTAATSTGSQSQQQQQQQQQQQPLGQSTATRPQGDSRDDDIVTSVEIPVIDFVSFRQNRLGEMTPPVAGRRDNPVVLVRDLLLPRAPRTASADGRLQPPSSAGAAHPQNRNQPANTNSAAGPNNNNASAAPGGPAAVQMIPNHNTQLQMARLIQAIVNAAPIHTDIHVQINTAGGAGGGNNGRTAPEPATSAGTNRTTANSNSAPHVGNPTNTTTTNTNTNGGSSSAAAGAGVGAEAGLHFLPRFTSVTLPTTSTQTRSTSRPQVHSIPPPAASHIRNLRPMPANILSTFDRFLSCNSHHIREISTNPDRSGDGMVHRPGSGETAQNNGGGPNGGEQGPSEGNPTTAPPTAQARESRDVAVFARDLLGSFPLTIFGSQFTLADFYNLVPNPNTFNRIRDSLQSYVNQSVFGGPMEDAEAVQHATNMLIDHVMTVLSSVGMYDRPEYDTRASLANLIRVSFPTCVCLIRDDTSPQFGVRLMRFLVQFVRRFFMIMLAGVGRNNARTFLAELLRSTLQLGSFSDSEATLLLLPTLERHLDIASRHDMFDIQQFLVIRQPAGPRVDVVPEPPAAADAATEANDGPLDLAGGDSRSSSMSSSAGTGQRESSPMDVDDAESTSTPELVSDIAEISISIEPPNDVNQCAAIVISASPPSVASSSSAATSAVSSANAAEQQSNWGNVTSVPSVPIEPTQGCIEAAAAAVALRAASLAEPMVPPPRPTDDDEELPSVNIGAESWHRHFPPNWIPVITRDLGRQRRQNPQAPFSDAYISSMASKRRKLITETKPPSDVHSLISDGIRRSFLGTGITPSSSGAAIAPPAASMPGGGSAGRLRPEAPPVAGSSSSAGGVSSGTGSTSNRFRTLDELANNIANDGALQMSYCEAMKASIRERLAKDTDYDAARFPNCSKYFEKQ